MKEQPLSPANIATRALALVLFILFSVPSSAAELTVTFDALTTQISSGWLKVDWQLTSGSWNQIRDTRPSLKVYVADDSRPIDIETTYTIPMSGVANTANLPLPKGWEPTRAELFIAAPNDTIHVRVNDTVAKRIAVRIGQSVASTSMNVDNWRRPVNCPSSSPGRIAVACGDVLAGEKSVACISTASEACFDPSGGVRACGSVFSATEDLVACVAGMARSPVDPAALIRQCGEGFATTTDQLACVNIVASSRRHPGTSIDACRIAMAEPAMRLACLRQLGSGERPLEASVLACAHIMGDATNTIACLGLASGAEFDPSEAILACGEILTGTSNLTQCVSIAVSQAHEPSTRVRACGVDNTSNSSAMACLRAEF